MVPSKYQLRSMVTGICSKNDIPRELRSLIWFNVERDHHSNPLVIGAAITLQAAWRRLRAIMRIPDIWVNIDEGPSADRWFAFEDRREAYRGPLP